MLRTSPWVKSCALLLPLALTFATSAAADTWLVNGSPVSGSLSPGIQTAEVEELPGAGESYVEMTVELVGTQIEVRCSGLELVNAHLEAKGQITTGARGRFSGCRTYLEGVFSEVCEPHTGPEEGIILTQKLKGALSKGLLFLKPEVGELFKVYEMGEECAIGEEIAVNGQMALKDSNGKIATEALTHLVESKPGTETEEGTVLWVFNPIPEHFIKVLGSVVLELGGKHEGLTWSGAP